MKKNSAKDFAIALYKTTKGLKGQQLEQAIKEFVGVLVRSGFLGQYEKVITEYEKYAKKQSGIIDIEIQSARPIAEKTKEKIKKAFGEQVEVKEKIDKDLLGGLKVKTENMIFDASLKKQLQLLKQKLT